MQKLILLSLVAVSLLLLSSSVEADCVNFEEMKAKLKAMSPEAQAAAKKFQAQVIGMIDKSLGELSPAAQAEIMAIMPAFPKDK